MRLNMEQQYLLKYSDNWADEIDIEGHCILSETELEEFLEAASKCECFEFYVGTNEEIEYEGKEGITEAVDYQAISAFDVEVLRGLGLADCGFASSFVDRVLDEAKGRYGGW